jgi:hypothetical protein
MPSFLGAPAQRAERLNPHVVATNAQRLMEEINDTLHPTFRLEAPDTRWDSVIPTLPQRRAVLHIVISGVTKGRDSLYLYSLTEKRSILLMRLNLELMLRTDLRSDA